MVKNEFIHLEIIDITQLQQQDVGGISSNENLILVDSLQNAIRSKIQPGRGGGV